MELLKASKHLIAGAIVSAVAFGGIHAVTAVTGSEEARLCANKDTGVVRYRTARCGKAEVRVQFNSEGPRGPAGQDGADGEDGAAGPAGPPGADGEDGAVGPVGPPGADGVSGGACQRGFECNLGDTGPGGGIVFYVAPTTFSSDAPCGSNCRYLEMAPSGWFGESGDPMRTWTGDSAVRTSAYGNSIGEGFANTNTIIAALPSDTDLNSAAILARNYTGGGLSDWYLPSKLELNEMCITWSGVAANGAGNCNGDATTGRSGLGGFSPTLADWPNGVWYWSSTEVNQTGQYYAWAQKFDATGARSDQRIYDDNKSQIRLVRPIRAF